MTTYSLNPAEYEATVEKFGKINARAAKRGFTGRFEITADRATERYFVEAATGNRAEIGTGTYQGTEPGYIVEEIRYNTTITGQAPSYEGWTFLALLDWDQHAGLIVRAAPGVETVDRDSLEEGVCGHCNVKRARRKTMLVHNAETGAQMQVGTTCIKDFLGWTATPVFYYADDAEREVDEILGGGSYAHEVAVTVESVLTVAWASTMAYGFVPASSSSAMPTRDVVTLALTARKLSQGERETVAGLAPYLEAAADKGREVRDFILSDDFAGHGEYVTNLKAIAAAELVSLRNFGILASAPQAWAKAQERTLVRQREAGAPSEWFGTKGDKVEFAGTIKVIRYIDGDWGSSTLYVIRDEETGREVKWFASKAALGNTEGKQVKIRGTIKAHEEYQGSKSTVLTRCQQL